MTNSITVEQVWDLPGSERQQKGTVRIDYRWIVIFLKLSLSIELRDLIIENVCFLWRLQFLALSPVLFCFRACPNGTWQYSGRDWQLWEAVVHRKDKGWEKRLLHVLDPQHLKLAPQSSTLQTLTAQCCITPGWFALWGVCMLQSGVKQSWVLRKELAGYRCAGPQPDLWVSKFWSTRMLSLLTENQISPVHHWTGDLVEAVPAHCEGS